MRTLGELVTHLEGKIVEYGESIPIFLECNPLLAIMDSFVITESATGDPVALGIKGVPSKEIQRNAQGQYIIGIVDPMRVADLEERALYTSGLTGTGQARAVVQRLGQMGFTVVAKSDLEILQAKANGLIE